jgi:hypothetical protein
VVKPVPALPIELLVAESVAEPAAARTQYPVTIIEAWADRV